MANLPGIDQYIDIFQFRYKGGTERYRTIIDLLIEHGHSFAVHGGRLYLSNSALERLTSEGGPLAFTT